MNQDENPYDVLGVSANATEADIKSAYRKAALRYHPDKQTNEQDRQTATEKFAKLSNAYEILSNPELKRQFDIEQQYSQYDHRTFHEPFRRRHFHDPFQVFEQVFREEFGRSSRSAPRGSGMRDSFFSPDPMFTRGSLFDDPFFSSRSQSRGAQRAGDSSSFFDNDPFFGASPFAGFFGGRDPFSEMRRMHESFHDGTIDRNQANNGNQSDGYITSTSTFTRMINGKQQTVTERIVRKRDGTIVEHHKETTGDGDFPETAALPFSNNGNNKQLEQHPSNQNNASDCKNELQRQVTKNTLQRNSSKTPKEGRRGWFW
ncbi:DnaJ homolog subfamily B member 6 [Fistulifera solaris]|jgi:curved DNA-binding protein CbpA|uniref:DnaJ homolog subfamily B member 6 n=1 Tax=Fistulifera solaris TaxID=1519565 RepID=A0A1Z5K5W8_FISSO|nr:DnaJ homolog subfamily B member 6 [Fistulifera solaris]|eukprot:GAX21481.1 DnaJ homolog subfamily B member 6 [Fistulifera solaris]